MKCVFKKSKLRKLLPFSLVSPTQQEVCLLLPAWLSRTFWRYLRETKIPPSFSKRSRKRHYQLRFCSEIPVIAMNSMFRRIFSFAFSQEFLLSCLLHILQTPVSTVALALSRLLISLFNLLMVLNRRVWLWFLWSLWILTVLKSSNTR